MALLLVEQLAVGEGGGLEPTNGTGLCCWGKGSGPFAFMLDEGHVVDVTCCPGCLEVLQGEGV